MKLSALVPAVLLCGLMGCGGANPEILERTRKQVLPSGKQITLIDVHFGFGARDNLGNDSFVVGYVSTDPNAGPTVNQQEALEVFELIRPVSEQWGLKEAEVEAFPTSKNKGSYVSYQFRRAPDGKWSSQSMKGTSYSF